MCGHAQLCGDCVVVSLSVCVVVCVYVCITTFVTPMCYCVWFCCSSVWSHEVVSVVACGVWASPHWFPSLESGTRATAAHTDVTATQLESTLQQAAPGPSKHKPVRSHSAGAGGPARPALALGLIPAECLCAVQGFLHRILKG